MEPRPREFAEEMSPEERMEALADALAEGLLHLAATGQLEEVLAGQAPRPVPKDGLPSGGKEGSVSNGP